MRLRWGVILTAALATFVVVCLSGPVRAEDGGPSAEELQAIHDEFCSHPGPCRVVNSMADPAQDDYEAVSPPPLYESLRQHGRPASDCPEAAEFYGADGEPVDAFLGPCPEIGEPGPKQ